MRQSEGGQILKEKELRKYNVRREILVQGWKPRLMGRLVISRGNQATLFDI